MEPGEERQFDGFVAYHALHQVQTGLVEVGIEEPVVDKETSSEVKKMTWQELLKEAGRYSWFRPGMNRQKIEEALKNEERPREETKETGTTAPPKEAKGAK